MTAPIEDVVADLNRRQSLLANRVYAIERYVEATSHAALRTNHPADHLQPVRSTRRDRVRFERNRRNLPHLRRNRNLAMQRMPAAMARARDARASTAHGAGRHE